MNLKRYVYILLGLLFLLILPGCGQVYAGTVASEILPEKEGQFDTPETVRWMNGAEILSGEITVSAPVEDDQAMSMIRESKETKIRELYGYGHYYVCFTVGSEHADKIHPYLQSVDGTPLSYNKITYTGNVYSLGNGTFCAPIPNGCQEFRIVIGDTWYQYPCNYEGGFHAKD